MKANYYGLREQCFYPDKRRDFPHYHYVDGGYGARPPSHQIRPEGFFSETKQSQRETRILSALPPVTDTHNTMTIKLRPLQAQNAGNFGRYLFVLSMLLTA